MSEQKTISPPAPDAAISSSGPCRLSRPVAQFHNGWFVVYEVRNNIFAISEPQYYQGNFSYLIIGKDKALLIDAGASAEHDITTVVKELTHRPCAVLPTHLHFDHLGNIARFTDIWLADTPTLAAFKQPNGFYNIPVAYTLGYFEQQENVTLKPKRLIAPDEIIDLGGVTLKVIQVAGHSPDGIVIYDLTANILFTGDHLYPTRLYSSDTPAYAASTKRLSSLINKDTLLLGAHVGNYPPAATPAMPASDLQDLKQFFSRLAAGTAQPKTLSLEKSDIRSATVYKVNDRISFMENIIWMNDTPFKH